MPDFFCTTEFDSVEHLFFCKSDSIYLNWKWDGYLLLKIYDDGDKSNCYEYVKLTHGTSCVEQNKPGEENHILFDKDFLTGKLSPICWDAKKTVKAKKNNFLITIMFS